MPIDSNDLNWWHAEDGFMLRYGRRAQVIVRVVQEDSIYPNMWRVEFVDRTDMVNLTRAKDAGATHAPALLNQKNITRRASGRPLARSSRRPAITLPESEAA